MAYEDLCLLSELPGVATACGPVTAYLRQQLPGFRFTEVRDGFLLAYPAGILRDEIRLLLVTHIDEVGGMVLFPREEGSWETLLIGRHPEDFVGPELQAFPYDATDAHLTRPCWGELSEDGQCLILHGHGLEPFKTFFTFRTRCEVTEDTICGKALDPRAAVYCLLKTAHRLARRDFGLLFCYAEETGSPISTQKGVHFVTAYLSGLKVIINVDCPDLRSVAGVQFEEAGLRLIEAGNLIDPTYTLEVRDRLLRRGLTVPLAIGASASETGLFAPLVPTLSVILPVIGIHFQRGDVNQAAVEHCLELLPALAEVTAE
jgi:putative aminopeptidase FrvX